MKSIPPSWGQDKMIDLLDFELPLRGKRILVTGHSGFTGGWACLWLRLLTSELAGVGLDPKGSPSLFTAAGIADELEDHRVDITDYGRLHDVVSAFRPQIILHLAAQALVRRSYRDPRQTFLTNTQGTANVLEVGRTVAGVEAVLCITTDKVYRNREWHWPYRESDRLGGKDPYSASKAAAEHVIAGYAAAFPSRDGKGPALAAARGGNIIGGGDWSEDRTRPRLRASRHPRSAPAAPLSGGHAALAARPGPGPGLSHADGANSSRRSVTTLKAPGTSVRPRPIGGAFGSCSTPSRDAGAGRTLDTSTCSFPRRGALPSTALERAPFSVGRRPGISAEPSTRRPPGTAASMKAESRRESSAWSRSRSGAASFPPLAFGNHRRGSAPPDAPPGSGKGSLCAPVAQQRRWREDRPWT